jgi:hypothetical protein
MKNKINIQEDDKFKIHVDKKTLQDPNKTKELAMLKRKNPNIEYDLETSVGSSQSSTSMAQMEENEVLEPEAVITPQDAATIKYLSNVVDNKTGNISQPFVIGAQKYQMVRGLAGGSEIVLAVFAHDERDDEGNNIIYPIEEFEQKIAIPAKLELESRNMQEAKDEESKEETYEGCKHFFVDTKTNKVRKFKTIEEMLSANKSQDEVYMGGPKFKKYMTERLFGKRKKVNELGTEPMVGDEDMTNKAEKLMDVIDNNTSVQNAIKTIKTPAAKQEVIAAFAELIGVPRNGLSDLVSQMKDISKQPKQQQVTQPVQESVVLTKNQMMEMLGNKRNVIKTVKVKDIK